MTRREKTLVAFGSKCFYCGGKLDANSMTIDHVIPWVAGGKDIRMNRVPACLECNTFKGNCIIPKTQLETIQQKIKELWKGQVADMRSGRMRKKQKVYPMSAKDQQWMNHMLQTLKSAPSHTN